MKQILRRNSHSYWFYRYAVFFSGVTKPGASWICKADVSVSMLSTISRPKSLSFIAVFVSLDSSSTLFHRCLAKRKKLSPKKKKFWRNIWIYHQATLEQVFPRYFRNRWIFRQQTTVICVKSPLLKAYHRLNARISVFKTFRRKLENGKLENGWGNDCALKNLHPTNPPFRIYHINHSKKNMLRFRLSIYLSWVICINVMKSWFSKK